MPVRSQLVVTGFTNDARGVLVRIARFTGGSRVLDLGIHRRKAGAELFAVVERRDHHVPPFPTARVIPIVPHHEPADAVVPHIDRSHSPETRAEPRGRALAAGRGPAPQFSGQLSHINWRGTVARPVRSQRITPPPSPVLLTAPSFRLVAPRVGALRRHTCHDRSGRIETKLTCGRRSASIGLAVPTCAPGRDPRMTWLRAQALGPEGSIITMATAHEVRDENGKCHKQVTVHLGLLGGTIFSEQIFMDLDGWGFILDGDSFTAWGENLRQDAQMGDPIHVTYTVDETPDGDWLNVRSLLKATMGEGWRVIDYIVLTDAKDWSEDVEIIGACA